MLAGEFIGWRLGVFLATKDPLNSNKKISVKNIMLARLERSGTNNLTSRADLSMTTAGMVANTYEPGGDGFGW
jgi:hypothetical protein